MNAREYFPGGMGVGPQDKQKHCFVSCYVNRCTLGLFPWLTAGIGYGWEVGNGWDSDSSKDIYADFVGIDRSYDLGKSCKALCEDEGECKP